MRTFARFSLVLGSSILLMSLLLLIIRQQSPQPPYIAFVSDRDGNPELYRMRTDGRQIKRLTYNLDDESSPTWSPDGRWIAYTYTTISYVSSGSTVMIGTFALVESYIHLMTATGGDIHPIIKTGDSQTDLAWSPDGRKLAFNAQVRDKVGVFIIDALKPAAPSLVIESSSPAHPIWSPDGKTLVFENWDVFPGILFRLQVDGSHPTQLYAGSQVLKDPAWSPDGMQLAVLVLPESSLTPEYLGLLPLDGGELQVIPNTDVYLSDPAWSPDGQWIAFTQNFDDLYRIRPNGEDLTQLTSGSSYDSEPVWSPIIDLPLRLGWLLAAGLILLGVGYAFRPTV